MTVLNPNGLKHSLLDSIHKAKENPNYLNSDSAFSRNGKISFEQVMLFPILMQKDNLRTEIFNLFPEDNLPSPSAMCQKRDLVKSDAFKDVFYSFTATLPHPDKFKGYRIIACDGSRLDLPYNPQDSETFVQNIKKRKGCNQMHITTFFDILNKIYLDAAFQYGNEMNERRDFCTMIDRFESDDKCLFICDRGFSSFNTFAHAIHDNRFFLFRLNSTMDISKFLDPNVYSQPQFDQFTEVTVCRKKKKKHSSCNNIQHLASKRIYDYLEPGSDGTDTLNIRFSKIKISDDTTEYLATNLPESISFDDLKALYHMRWGIETSYKHLKYAVDLIYIHSLKKEFTLQEIYGKLIMFNFALAIEKLAEKSVTPQKAGNKYTYTVNVTQAIKYCVLFLKNKLTDLIDKIIKCLLPDRPGRHFERNLRRQSAESLGYR